MRFSTNIKYYFIADIISLLGSNLALIALDWFILEKTGFNENVGIFMSLGMVAGLIAAPFGGIITDQLCRKTTIINLNYFRAFSILCILLVLVYREFNIYCVYFLAIINGIGFNIYLPASRALLQEIIQHKEFTKWNSLIEIGIHITMVAAGAITGILYKTCGIYFILFLDALSFVVSNFFMSQIRYEHTIKTSTDNVLSKLYDVSIYIKNNKSLSVFILVMLTPHVATITLSIVLPGYVLNHLNSNSGTYGLLNMFLSIGAIIGAIIMSRLHRKHVKNHHIRFMFIASLLSLLITIFTWSIPMAYVTILIFGLSNSSIKIIAHSTIMRLTDKAFMGRIVSIKNSISTVLQMISAYTIGLVMDKYGDISGYFSLLVIMTVSFLAYLYFNKYFKRLL